MKFFFDIGDRYCKESGWKTLAALKFCLFSMGMVIGVLLPDRSRTAIIAVFGALFIATYIPLMVKLFRIWKQMKEEKSDRQEEKI